MNRRKFLNGILWFLITLIGGKLLIDFLKFGPEGEETVVIPLENVGNSPAVIDGVIIWRSRDSLSVFSSHCTHLGCILKFDRNEGIFECPCHGSRFSIDGNVIHGPAKKPLRKLDYTVRDGKIFVKL